MIYDIELFKIYFSPGHGTVIPINFEDRNGTKFVRYLEDFSSYWKVSISSENRIKKSCSDRDELSSFRMQKLIRYVFVLKDEI